MHYEVTKKHIDDQKQALVSIITPVYNAEKFIAETITSIQKQTYSNWELIIVDDSSEDDSISIAQKFASKDPRIQLIELPKNKGTAYCRNHATEVSNGTYIAFLDSDDLWHPEKLEKQLHFMMQYKCLVSYTSYLQINETGKSLNKRIVALPLLSYKKQLRNNYVGNLTGMYNAEELGKILSPNIRKRQDWAIWLEAIKRSKKPAMGLQEDMAYYRVRKGSISSNKFNLIKYNFGFYKNYLSYSTLKATYFLFLFFIEYFFVRPKQIQKIN